MDNIDCMDHTETIDGNCCFKFVFDVEVAIFYLCYVSVYKPNTKVVNILFVIPQDKSFFPSKNFCHSIPFIPIYAIGVLLLNTKFLHTWFNTDN